MPSPASRLALVASVVTLACSPLGCAPATTDGPDQTPRSAQATGAVDTGPLTGAGPVSTPEKGDAERVALMDAARQALETTDLLIVYQLLVQGDTAFADLERYRYGMGDRTWVAFTNTDARWRAAWHAPFGDADEDTVREAAPYLTDEVLDRVDWDTEGMTPADFLSAEAAFRGRQALSSSTGLPMEDLSADDVTVVGGPDGTWWSSLTVRSDDPVFDHATVYLMWDMDRMGWDVLDSGAGLDAVEAGIPPDVAEGLDKAD